VSEKKGIYLHTNHGDYEIKTGITIYPGKYVYIKSKFKPSITGQWTVNPAICISTLKSTLKGTLKDTCHNFETSCTFDVFVECPANWSCLTEEDASKNFENYVKLSNDLCGYKISGYTAAMIKIPMYCYQRRTPDLSISDVWPYESTPGVYSEVRALIYNQGNGFADNFKVAFYVDGTPVGNAIGYDLGPGENTVVAIKYPHSCEGNQNVYTAVVDPEDVVKESDENNNKFERAYECTKGETGIPNIEITNAYVNYSDYCNPINYQNNPIIVEIRNSGNQTSPSTDGRIYIDGRWSYTFHLPELQPNDTAVVEVALQYTCSGDEDAIRVVVDSQDTVVESNEGDNEFQFSTSCIVTPEGGDLVITNISSSVTDFTMYPDGTILPLKSRISYEITNVGEGYACSSHTGLYVDGVLIAKDWVGPLAQGEKRIESFAVQYNWKQCSMPADEIRVKADVDGKVEEVNEDNNDLTTTFTCIEFPPPPKPDLIVESITKAGTRVSNLTLKIDLTLKIVVKNIGSAASSPTDVGVYVNYHKLGDINIPALNPGSSYTARYYHWTPQWETNRVSACADLSEKWMRFQRSGTIAKKKFLPLACRAEMVCKTGMKKA